MGYTAEYSNGQRDSTLGSKDDILRALEDGEKSRDLKFNSLAGACLRGTSPFLREYIEDGDKESEKLLYKMTEHIKDMLKERLDAVSRNNSLNSLHSPLFTGKQIVASLRRIVNQENLGDSQRDQVASQLLEAFINGVDNSLQGKGSPSHGVRR